MENKMNLIESIKEVSDKFVYTADKTGDFIKDNWFVMSETDGEYRGDCEDYALTVLYILAGGYFKMLWNLLIGKYSLHIVASAGDVLNHCVGRVDDMWFDNWTLSAKNREEFFERTQHKYGKKISFFIIVSKLIMGKLFGKK
jgi:hypothetical protein